MNANSRRGFTLVELVVVLAVIIILAAIAIPLFSSMTERAQESTCMSNLAAGTRLLRYQEALENKELGDETVKSLLTESLGATETASGYTGLCPSGGEYQVAATVNGVKRLRCTKHGMTAVETINSSAQNIASLLQYSIDAYFSKRSGTVLNSTGPNFGDDIKARMAEELNITTDFDFRVYKINGNEYKIYICDPIDGKELGDEVAVTGYYLKNGAVVSTGSEQSVAIGTESVDGSPIKVITANQYKWD